MIAALRALRNGTLSYWRSEARWESSSTCDMTVILHLGLRIHDAVCLSVCGFFFFSVLQKCPFPFRHAWVSRKKKQKKTHCSLSIFFSPPQQHFAGKKDQKDFRSTMKGIFWSPTSVPWSWNLPVGKKYHLTSFQLCWYNWKNTEVLQCFLCVYGACLHLRPVLDQSFADFRICELRTLRNFWKGNGCNHWWQHSLRHLNYL